MPSSASTMRTISKCATKTASEDSVHWRVLELIGGPRNAVAWRSTSPRPRRWEPEDSKWCFARNQVWRVRKVDGRMEQSKLIRRSSSLASRVVEGVSTGARVVDRSEENPNSPPFRLEDRKFPIESKRKP